MNETNISISDKITSKLKSLFYQHRIVLLEWYLVASTCYMSMVSMNINMIGTAIAIGMVNTFIVAPISHALIYGNKEEEFPKQNLPKNIVKSIIVCSIMFGLYYVVNFNLFKTHIEPITFGIIYKLIDYAFLRVVKLWK
ncbi:MAG: hypothetical protein R3Y29_00540 [bacterium]